MRLLHKALLREMSATSALALVALSAIALVVLVVRLIGQVALGKIDGDAILPFLAFGYLRLMPVLLSLSLFIGVIVTLSRYWQDNEMVIWVCAGVSPVRLLRTILVFALPVAALIAVLTLGILPWAAVHHAHYERQLSAQRELASLSPGVFVERGRGRRTFFVEELVETGPKVKNVFIYAREGSRTGIVVASRGHLSRSEHGIPYLTLERGRRYEGTPGAADYRVIAFERYRFRLEDDAPAAVPTHTRMLSTAALLHNPTPENQSEWVGRLGHPLSALILSLMALPLSLVNPRSGRALGILFALLVYTAYNNAFGLSQGWVTQGRLGALEALGLVHGLALAVLAALFAWRFGLPRRGRADR